MNCHKYGTYARGVLIGDGTVFRPLANQPGDPTILAIELIDDATWLAHTMNKGVWTTRDGGNTWEAELSRREEQTTWEWLESLK